MITLCARKLRSLAMLAARARAATPAACSSLPTAPPRPLLVFVPFTSADVPALVRGHELWQQTLPCAADGLTAPASRPGLLYLFNGRCGTNASDSCAQVTRAVRDTAATSCFRSVVVRGAHLSGKEDRYDKQRRTAAWTAGPNNLFHKAVAKARRLGYWYMLQLEPDVLPLRPGWLDHVVCLTHLSDAWVVGSALLANCTREEKVTDLGCTCPHLPTTAHTQKPPSSPHRPDSCPRVSRLRAGNASTSFPRSSQSTSMATRSTRSETTSSCSMWRAFGQVGSAGCHSTSRSTPPASASRSRTAASWRIGFSTAALCSTWAPSFPMCARYVQATRAAFWCTARRFPSWRPARCRPCLTQTHRRGCRRHRLGRAQLAAHPQ